MDEVSRERSAPDDARFRTANEQIRAAAREYGHEGLVPFICECADARCHAIVRMSLDAYEEVRSRPRRFLSVPGHEAAAGGSAAVVAERNGYFIVETE